MTLPINEFSQVEIEQKVDVVTEQDRYFRNRREGNKKPYWEISLTTKLQTLQNGKKLGAYLNSLKGALNTFSLNNPDASIKTQTGLTVGANATAGSTQFNLNGFDPNEVDCVAAGDFLKIAGHEKVYQFVADASANGTGTATVTITPELFVDITAGLAVDYGDQVSFQVCLKNAIKTNIEAKKGNFIIHDITLIEQG